MSDISITKTEEGKPSFDRWLNWDPSKLPIPTGLVDVRLRNGWEAHNVNAKLLRWSWDYGVTPSSVVQWKPSK